MVLPPYLPIDKFDIWSHACNENVTVTALVNFTSFADPSMADDEYAITNKILERKRAKRSRSKKNRDSSEKRAPAGPVPPKLNRYLNAALLWLSFGAAVYELSQSDTRSLKCLLIWLIFSFVSLPQPGATIDSWILPVALACTFEPRVVVVVMSASLGSRGLMGAFLGVALAAGSQSVPRFCYACPLVVWWLLTLLAGFSGASLDPNERVLLSTGVGAFIFLGASNLGLPWVILTSALVGFIPCQWTVPRAVQLIRNSRRGLDTEALQFWAGTTFVLYFLSAGLMLAIFSISRPVFSEFFETLSSDWPTVCWWISCLVVAFTIASFAPQFDLDSRRKLWHICSVVMFLPTSTRKLTPLALSCALALFLKLELVRAAGLPPLGPWLHKTLKAFTDYRDTRGPLVISHIYLLLGIASPVFAGNGSPAGVLCLGLGDTFASQVGRRYGRLKVFGDKTLEGTLAFALAVSIGLTFVHDMEFSRVIVIGTVCALMEAVSPVNDNLILPMYMLLLERLAMYF